MTNDPPELAALIPSLTHSTITDDERTALYHAAMSGHQLPLRCRRWRPCIVPECLADALQCPGCGYQIPSAPPGPLACDGCGNVYLVPNA